jgi:uncharacterized protein (DUF433 family)
MARAETLVAAPVSIRFGEGRVFRVANTRVVLETIVDAYERGNTPEQIADDYDVRCRRPMNGLLS